MIIKMHMNAFNYDDSLYVTVDMCGFKCAYASRDGEMQTVNDLPDKSVRLPAEEEQQLCNDFIEDLTKTLMTPKVLKLDHNYVFLVPSDTGLKIDNIKWCYPFQDRDDTESLMDYIVDNIMHAGGTFWNLTSRPPTIKFDIL